MNMLRDEAAAVKRELDEINRRMEEIQKESAE
jgi:hypothetical protein